MKNFCYIIIISFFVLLQTACNRDYKGNLSWQPASLNLNPPPGPENYRKGWADGCESGANAYSSGFYKQIKAFDYRYDATLRNDTVYTQVWKDAFIYCSIYWERLNSLGGNI